MFCLLSYWSHGVRDTSLGTCSGRLTSLCHARAVTMAKTGQEALAVFRSAQGQRIDLMLTDHLMPKV